MAVRHGQRRGDGDGSDSGGGAVRGNWVAHHSVHSGGVASARPHGTRMAQRSASIAAQETLSLLLDGGGGGGCGGGGGGGRGRGGSYGKRRWHGGGAVPVVALCDAQRAAGAVTPGTYMRLASAAQHCSAGAARRCFKSAAPIVLHGDAGCPSQPPRHTGCRRMRIAVHRGPRARRDVRARARRWVEKDRCLVDKTHTHLTYDATERNVSLEHYNAQTQRPEAGACGVSRLTSTAPTHREVRSCHAYNSPGSTQFHVSGHSERHQSADLLSS